MSAFAEPATNLVKYYLLFGGFRFLLRYQAEFGSAWAQVAELANKEVQENMAESREMGGKISLWWHRAINLVHVLSVKPKNTLTII